MTHVSHQPKIQPQKTPGRKVDNTPDDNDRKEIGPTDLAYNEWATAGIEVPDVQAMRKHRHEALIKAMSDGVDGEAAQCHEYMEMDFMQVELKDSLKSVLADIQTRSPQAVVAVDENQEFVGYFSPGDYQEAVQLVDNLKGLNL